MKWIKQIFCKHDFGFLRNIYGEEIVMSGYKRSIWQCIYCKKRQYRDRLEP